MKHNFKPGDRVRIRAWEDMEKEFGLTSFGEILVGDRIVFSKSMRCLCGRTAKIQSIAREILGVRVTLIDWDNADDTTRFTYSPEMLEPATVENKILITTDGKETLARLYEGKKEIKNAAATCNPDDAFDFVTGAKLAFDRLVEKDKPADGIDWAAFIRGEVMVKTQNNKESKRAFLEDAEKNCPTLLWASGNKPTHYVPTDGVHFHTNGKCLFYCSNPTRFAGQEKIKQLVVYAPAPSLEKKSEPLKLYCVKDDPGWLTKDKVYEFVDGDILCDQGGHHPRRFDDYADFAHHNRKMAACLIPLVRRAAKAGEWVYIVDGEGHDNPINTVGEVTSYGSGRKEWVRINGRSRGLIRDDQYLVLDGYRLEPEPEKPKGYSGKVVCAESKVPWFTEGKVYEFQGGWIKDNDGDRNLRRFSL